MFEVKYIQTILSFNANYASAILSKLKNSIVYTPRLNLGARQVIDEGSFMEFKPPEGAAAVATTDSRARIGVSEPGGFVLSPVYF